MASAWGVGLTVEVLRGAATTALYEPPVLKPLAGRPSMPRALEESGETLGRPGMAAMTMGESSSAVLTRRPGGAEVTEGVQPVEVEVAHPRQHGVDVPRGAPVRVDGVAKGWFAREVAATAAQVLSHSQSRVVDVLRVGQAVGVAIHAQRSPGVRQHLHQPHGTVPRGAAVERPAVGVRHRGPCATVEQRAVDGWVQTVVRTDRPPPAEPDSPGRWPRAPTGSGRTQ